jgi:hypothetical protein
VIDQINSISQSLPALLEQELTSNLLVVNDSITRLTALSKTRAGLETIQINKIGEALAALQTAKQALQVAGEPFGIQRGKTTPTLRAV